MVSNIQILGRVSLLLLVCASVAAGFLWLPPIPMFVSPALARIAVFHIPCSIVGSVATAVGVWYAICYLKNRRLEGRHQILRLAGAGPSALVSHDCYRGDLRQSRMGRVLELGHQADQHCHAAAHLLRVFRAPNRD